MRTTLFFVLLVCGLLLEVQAQSVPRYTFDFRGQSVHAALEKLVTETTLSLIYDQTMVAGQTTQCAADKATSAAVLHCILKGTRLVAEPIQKDLYMMRVDSTRTMLPDSSQVGTIRGQVREKSTREGLVGSNVRLVGTAQGAATDTDGLFEIGQVAAGTYTLEASMLGFMPHRLLNIQVVAGQVTDVVFDLEDATVQLSEVVVTPGFFSLMQRQPTVPQGLTREQIQTLPTFGDDVYRSLQRLPGLSGNDLSAKFTVRGGEHEEVLVRLDGLDLYEPFHLKDVPGGGLFSIIDADAVAGMEMQTGAFTAEYGNRLSGVLNIQSAPALTDRTRSSLGASLSNMRFQTEGHFGDKKGSWLVVARRGYFDLVLKLANADNEIDPVYYDVLGKITYQVSPKHRLAAHILTAQDKLDFTSDGDDGVDVLTSFGNTYSWLNLQSVLRPRLLVESHLAIGQLRHDRFGAETDPDGFVEVEDDRVVRDDDGGLTRVEDDRTFRFATFRQDWTYEATDQWVLKGGYEAKRVGVEYDYANITEEFAPIHSQLEQIGTQTHSYVSSRVRPWATLTLETGLRFAYASWTDDRNWSPRVNLAYAARPGTVLRAGWGLFHQTQALHHLDVRNRDETFYSAEQSEHRVLGLEQQIGQGLRLRVEAYEKRLTNLRPHYLNVAEGIDSPFPEVESDRIRLTLAEGRARGLEVFLQQNQHEQFTWNAAYSLAQVNHEVASITRTAAFKGRLTNPLYTGVTLPRAIDQRHTVQLDATYRPNSKWSINVSWLYRSGWPYTEANFERVNDPDGGTSFAAVFGRVADERLPAYHRLDIRLHRSVSFKHSRFAFFIDLHNVLNRENVWYYQNQFDVRDRDGLITNYTSPNLWMPFLPTFGIRWDRFH